MLWDEAARSAGVGSSSSITSTNGDSTGGTRLRRSRPSVDWWERRLFEETGFRDPENADERFVALFIVRGGAREARRLVLVASPKNTER